MSQIGQYRNNSLIPTIDTLTGNTGGAVGPDGAANIDVLGDEVITYVTGVPASHQLTVSLIGGDDGQLIIGSTAGNPDWASLTSTDGSITFTTGANSLDLSVATVIGSVVGLIPDSGTSPVVPDGSGYITDTGGTTGLTFVGGTNTITLSGTLIVGNGGTGATSLTDHGVVLGSGTAAVTVTSVGTDGQVFLGATGADPAFATLTSTGGTITFTPGANSLNLEADGIAIGAILTITGDSGGAISPDGSGNFGLVGGTTGLTFAGASNAQTLGGTLIVANGGTGNTTFTAYAPVCAGTTATGVMQSADTGFSTSGYVLTSNGSSALPSWQAAASPELTITSLDDTDSAYTVLSTDQYLSCDVSSGVLEIDLPNSTTDGRVIYIKDAGGDAATNNITVTTVGGAVNIDGDTSFVMNTNYESINVVWNNTSGAYEVF